MKTRYTWLAIWVMIPLWMGQMALGQITIDPASRSFAKEGGGGAILTAGTGTWTASTTADWINITPRTTGTAGESCVYVVNANFSADSRQGIITVEGNTHTVNQTGYLATITPTSTTVAYEGGGGTIAIMADAGVSWSAAANADWVTVTPLAGTGAGSVSYTIEPYGGVTPRTTSITIAGKTFVISQTGLDVNLAPFSVEVGYEADIVQIQVSALWNTAWSVMPDAPWISVIDAGSGAGDATVTLAVGSNPSYLIRAGTVQIGSAAFSIQQLGTPYPLLDIVPPTATADPIGAYGNVAVLATPDAPWTAKSLDAWLSISQGASGAGNGNIQYVVSANPNMTERVGRIQIHPPVYQARSDLRWMLYAHIINNSQDQSGWGRNITAILPYTFRGTQSLNLSGQAFSRDDDSFSVAFCFRIDNADAVNRLMQVTRAASSYTAVYVDAENKLVIQCDNEIYVTDLQVQTNKNYQLILTTDESNHAKIYAGIRGQSIAKVGATTFSKALFPTPYVTPSRLGFGYSNLPTSGYLSNATMNDLRIYGRELNEHEAQTLFELAETSTPYGDFTHVGDTDNVCAEYGFYGHGQRAKPANGFVTVNNCVPDANRFGLSQHALKDGSITINNHHAIFATDQPSATYNFWVRFDSFPSGSGSMLVFKRATNNLAAFSTTILANGRVQFSVDSTSVSYDTSLQVGKWHMITIAGLHGGSTVFYVDGEEIGNTANFASYRFGHYYLYVSQRNWYPILTIGGSGWDGAIDYAGFYEGQLTSPQIKAIYEKQKPKEVFHVVTQGVVAASLEPESAVIPAEGGAISTMLTLAQNVTWETTSETPWLQVTSASSGAGPTMVEILAEANPSVYPREGTVSIATKTFAVIQAGRGSSVECESPIFGTDGGSTWVDVSTEGNAQWQAVSQVPWLTVAVGENGSGAGSVFIVADPYTEVSSSRVGSVLIAGHMVYFTQRGFTLSVIPQVAQVGSNAGAGTFGVSAPLGAVWEALATHPWITIIGGMSGQGDGTLHYSVAANTTGEARTGRIIVSGVEYLITQLANLLVTVYTDGGGTINGAGSYETLDTAVITAIPDAGYVFSHWSGDAVGSANPLSLHMDGSKTVKAHFMETGLADTIALNSRERLGFYTTDQIQDLALDGLVLEKNPGVDNMSLYMGILHRTSLTEGSWSNMLIKAADVFIEGGRVRLDITPSENVGFYRLQGNAE